MSEEERKKLIEEIKSAHKTDRIIDYLFGIISGIYISVIYISIIMYLQK